MQGKFIAPSDQPKCKCAYLSPPIYRRWMLHCFALVALCVAFVGVEMHMEFGIVKKYFSFVILMCILFANYEDWRRLGGATCIVRNASNGIHTTPKMTPTFGAQIEDREVTNEGDSFVNENVISMVHFLWWLIPGNAPLYSTFLRVLFWCHLASFGIRCCKFCTSGNRCCTITRFFMRCALTGAGLLTILVLRWSYGNHDSREPW